MEFSKGDILDGDEKVWAGEQILASDGSAMKVYPIGAGSWIWDEVEK